MKKVTKTDGYPMSKYINLLLISLLYFIFYSGSNINDNTIKPGLVSLNERNPTATVALLITFEERVQRVADTNHIHIK